MEEDAQWAIEAKLPKIIGGGKSAIAIAGDLASGDLDLVRGDVEPDIRIAYSENQNEIPPVPKIGESVISNPEGYDATSCGEILVSSVNEIA